MTEINVDSKLIIFFIFLLLWVFSLGVILQATYNITSISIPIPDNAIYCILGLIIGAIATSFYHNY